MSQGDRATCVLLEAAFYGAAEAPLKRLRPLLASAAKQGERWLLREVTFPMGTSLAGGR